MDFLGSCIENFSYLASLFVCVRVWGSVIPYAFFTIRSTISLLVIVVVLIPQGPYVIYVGGNSCAIWFLGIYLQLVSFFGGLALLFGPCISVLAPGCPSVAERSSCHL